MSKREAEYDSMGAGNVRWENHHDTQNQGAGYGAYGQQYQAQQDGPTAYPNGGATGAGAPRKRTHKVRWAIIAVLVGAIAAFGVALVVGVAMSGTTAMSGGSLEAPAGSSAPSQPKDGTQHFTMGQSAIASTVGGTDALDVTVAAPRTSKGGEFDQPSGDHYLIATVTVKALTTGQTINPLDFKAVGADGTEIDATFVGEVTPPQLQAKDLGNGQTVKGSVVFDIPLGAKIAGIAYAPAYSTLGVWDVPAA